MNQLVFVATFCFAVMALVVFSEGKIVESKAKEIIEKMSMKSKDNKENKDMIIYNTCKDVASKDPNLKDPCDIASKIYTCIRENALKIGFPAA
ncbi:hypothetical protein B566_EDAN006090 [Ephemera danica]|nr:hypothetical protein B566_EDAN006090 [Ephemera danica]